MVLRHHLVNQLPDIVLLQPCGFIQLPQSPLKPLVVHINGLPNKYPFISGPLKSLFIHEKLLVKLFSRPQPCKLDVDIPVGFITGQPDQILGHVQDSYRFSHVQHKYFASHGIGAGLQHQAYRLGYGHEIPYDIPVGHGHRPPVFYLFLKQGNHASITSQHIPKSDRHKLSAALLVAHLYDHLAEALAGPHDVGGIHRLIRGYQDETPGAVLHGCPGGLIGAQYIVLDGFVGAVLHQRHMLVGRCVVYNIRPVCAKQVI